MRCILLVCLLLAVANASYMNKHRFNRLLHGYQNRFQLNDDIEDPTMFGSDETDDYIDDYTQEIRRQKYAQQCTRFGGEEDVDADEDNFDCEGPQCYEQNSDFESDYDNTDPMSQSKWVKGESQWVKGQLSRQFGRSVAREIEETNTRLASRLYKQCKDERDDKNTVVSPVSIQLALAALNKGARGETKRQINRVLCGRVPPQQGHQVFKTIMRSLKGLHQTSYSPIEKRCKINTVTGIFVSQRTPAQIAFIQSVKTTLGCAVKKCDFQRQPQQCRQMINRFVSQRTQQKLPNIVPQDAITDNTKMILVNALHLKANWGRQMRQCTVRPSPFFPLESEKVKTVPMLKTRGVFKYYEDELVKIVGVPTEQQELTLYVIVPKEKDGLTDVEKVHLQDGQQLKQLLDICDKRVKQVDVQLPKIQIKHKVDVRRTLLKQGVTDAFDCKRADFSGITGVNQYQKYNKYETEYQKPYDSEDQYESMELDGGARRHHRRSHVDNDQYLNSQDNWEQEQGFQGYQEYQGLEGEKSLHLNKFIHQTTIKINENGILASSGSGNPIEEIDDEELGHFNQYRQRLNKRENFEDLIGGYSTSGPLSQYRVKADRAFAIVLKHNPTQQLLLVGRIIDAAQKQNPRITTTINNVDQY